jgi:hypothetical protein
LKKFVGTPPSTPPDLPPIHNGVITPQPVRLERVRVARGVRQLLVHWQGEPPESATWEDLEAFRERFPHFQLEDELLREEGRDVMWGTVYSRSRRARDVRRAAARLRDAATAITAGATGGADASG